MPDISPAVSVIIPTYNRAHLLRRALHSVLHQSYQNIEVIIVDDGSTDDTKIIVMSFQDTRVRYIRHDIKCGAAAARNTGIKLASSEFIAFQDSDDEWLCEKLEKQMELFIHAGPEVGVIYTGFIRFEDHQAFYRPAEHIQKSGKILRSLLNGNYVTTQAVVVRRDCFEKVGLFDEQLPRFQDWELFIRIAKCYDFICINQPLLIAFHSAKSITADERLFPIAIKLVLEKHQDVFCQHRTILARNYYSLGVAICAAGDVTEGASYFVRSFTLNPWRLMCWIRWISTLPGAKVYRFSSKLIDQANRVVAEIWPSP